MNDSGKWSMNDWWYRSWLLCIYGCVFFPLLSTAFTVMRICVFSADWCYCSWLSCIFVCFLTIDDIALDFYADLPKVQLRQMQGHGPYLSSSTFNTSISKKKGKCILIIEPAVTKIYASIGLSCTVLVAMLIRRYTQDERSESLSPPANMKSPLVLLEPTIFYNIWKLTSYLPVYTWVPSYILK